MKKQSQFSHGVAPGDIATPGLAKAPTGILGFDDIAFGGVPRGRPTLVCGGVGCGKTLFAMQFLIAGAARYREPGVFMAFEESARDLTENFRGFSYDLDQLIQDNKITIDYVRIDRSEIEETGDYDLEGLFVRLGLAIDSIGAKRVVIDTIEALFSGFTNEAVLRAELRRLFRWLKDKGVTAIITGERGEGTLTRQGLEEYVSDCVVLLDHRVAEQVSTRRLRIVKYRGTVHGTNEYPFLIDTDGITVFPITAIGAVGNVSDERISSGLREFDSMLGGRGFFRGSIILASGTPGSGKTSLANHFVDAACGRGEKAVYLAFEESQNQMVRNMRSIGIHLERWIENGLLHLQAMRSAHHGLEAHLVKIYKLVETFQPRVLVMDPIDSMMGAGTTKDASAMLTRLIDFLEMRQITAFFTDLSGAVRTHEANLNLPSIIDTWICLRSVHIGAERKRIIYILKSRGMAHSNEIRKFSLGESGLNISAPLALPTDPSLVEA